MENSTKRKKERETLIDIMKAVMILVVSFYHLVYRTKDGFTDRAIREVGYLTIPFFFMLSGYFYRKSDMPFGKMLAHRMKEILLPAVIVTGIMLIVLGPYYALVYGYGFKEWIEDVTITYLRPELTAVLFPSFGEGGQLFQNISPVWYIWTLSWSSLLFYLVMRISYDRAEKMAVPVCVMCVMIFAGALLYAYGPALSWTLQLVPLYTGIMMMGTFIARYRVFEKLKALPLLPSVLISVVFGALHFLLFDNFGMDGMYLGILGEKDILTAFIFVIQTLIGGFCIFTLARILEKIPVMKDALAWTGRNTLTILLLHAEFGGLAADMLHTYNKPGLHWYLDPLPAETVIKSVISFIIAMAGCVIVILLKEKTAKRRLK
ncbi:MAG: acyltransferase [Lachnospiraceae bacterium]|nr:acyltransferase [Lachnospiraceae bacterium]